MESRNDLQLFLLDLHQFCLIFRRRWRLTAAVFIIIFGTVAAKTYLRGPTYQAQGRLLLEKVNATSSVTESGREIGELRAVGANDPVANEVEIIRSVPIVQQVIDQLALQDDEGEPLSARAVIQNRLSVDKVRGTDLLQIAYSSESKEEAAMVVNSIMETYLQNSVDTNRHKAIQASQFIRDQLPKSKEQLKQAELNLQGFKELHQISDLIEEKKASVLALESVKKRLSDTRVEKRRAEEQSRALQRRIKTDEKQALDISSVAESSGVQDVVLDLQKTEQLLVVAQKEFQPNHPRIEELTSKQQQLKQLLQGRLNQLQVQSSSPLQLQSQGINRELMEEQVRVGVVQEELQQQLHALTAEKQQYEQRTYQIPGLERRHRELEQKLLASQDTYQNLLAKLNEIQITANLSESNGRIVEYADVPVKFEMKPIFIRLMLGILLGSFMAVGLAVLVDVKDKSIKTVREAESLFGYPLLGIVPSLDMMKLNGEDVSVASNLFVRDFPASPMSETFRMLHSNIRFLQSDTTLKTIAVTSSIKDEGKSTVAANLATAMAQQGRKVLLLDADLRRPKQHQLWEIPQFEGVSDVIVGETEIDDVIHPVLETLDVMIAGATPPNPSALIDSHRMKSMLETLAERYDYVVIDTPPLLAANETRIFGDIADGVLMVVRPSIVESQNLTSAKKILTQLEPKVLGLVANAVQPQDESSSYFYYEKNDIEVRPQSINQQPLLLEK